MTVLRLNKKINIEAKPPDSRGDLSKRVARGGLWSFTLRISSRLFVFVRMVILARLLAPNDFGLMGLALLMMTALEKFSETGFLPALVQKKENISEYLDAAWTAQIIRSILLFGILFGGAPLIALFFDAPRATAILRVIAIAELFKGFTNIGVVYFRKELEFNKQFIYQFSGIITNLVVAISAALIFKNVWALVFGLLAGHFVQFTMSYVVQPYRPRIKIDLRKIGELFIYGRWVLACGIVGFFAMQMDSVVLGKMLGITALGFYQMAYRISNLVGTEVAEVISIVVFPAFSKLQSNIPKLREGFLRSFEVTAAISIPLCVGLALLGFDFTYLFLGEKWIPIIQALRLLAITAPFLVLTRIISPLFGAVGRPKLTFLMYLSRFGVMGVFVFPLTKSFGVVGTALTVLLSVLLTIPIWWHKAAEIVEVSSYRLFKEIVPSIVAAFVMSIFIMVTKQAIKEPGIWRLLLSALTGVVGYFGALLLFWKRFHNGPIGSLLFVRRSLQS
ncbi:lipopolysaccharide biosynthesis protein [Candidatus Omnitrophota bacterium]